MQKNQRLLSGHRVVPFEQSGAFFYRRARRHLDKSNYLSALGYLRKAVERDPKNSDYWLDMAETYTGMSCFDASNHILFSIAQTDAHHECFFGMGCNFLGLQEYEKARESFLTYIRLEPEGPYREDIEDMLDLLEEQLEWLPESQIPQRISHLAACGRQAVEAGEPQRAIRFLEKALIHEPGLLTARNHLALAYSQLGDTERALNEAAKVLKRDEDNLHAHCLLAIFYGKDGKAEESQAHVDQALAIKDPGPGDLACICQMLCQLKLHSQALERLSQLRTFFPYDAHTLHSLAVANVYLGSPAKAIRYWNRILEIEPDDIIAPWFIAQTRMDMEGARQFEPDYHYQVPQDEIMARFRRINQLVQSGLATVTQSWRSNDDIRRLLLWGLTLSDISIKRAFLNLIASFRDPDAERILRMYLARRNEPDHVKRDVFGMLKQMEAVEPYIAFLDNEIVEVHVNLLSDSMRIPPEYERVLRIAAAEMNGRYPPDHMHWLTERFVAYIRKNEQKLPAIRRPEAWAAALEYTYCLDKTQHVSITELCKRYGTTSKTLRRLTGCLSEI